MKIIYILGTDGSGKTTLAHRLAAEGVGGLRLTYLYCQVRPILIWPARALARFLYTRKTNEFEDFSAFNQRKKAATRGKGRLARLYSLLWYADFLLQTWPKLFWARLRGGTVIMDRYYLDTVVNQGVLQGSSTEEMLVAARFFERLLPKASRHVFLDVSEEEAYRRKDDIQSPEYLRERKERYLALADHYGFEKIDADQSAGAVFKEVAGRLSGLETEGRTEGQRAGEPESRRAGGPDVCSTSDEI